MGKKYTLAQVKGIIEDEGLGYAVTRYLSHDNIEDQAFAALWREAEAILASIEEVLKDVEPRWRE